MLERVPLSFGLGHEEGGVRRVRASHECCVHCMSQQLVRREDGVDSSMDVFVLDR